jgi:phosphoglycerol transferase MdoB-like AlkP superfamily enzyme
MLSSDQNVENIAQLIEVLKHYFGLQKEYLKLDVIDKVVRLLTATALAILFFVIISGVLLFFWFGFTYWLSKYTGVAGAFFIVAAINALLLLLFVVLRKPLIERPLVQFLARLFMS